MEFIETTKGRTSLVLEGFCYRKRRTNKDNTIVWQCIHEKTKYCKGAVVSLEDQVISVKEHVCIPNEAAVDVRVAVSKARKRARDDANTSVPQIFKEELEPLQNRGYELVTAMPQYEKMKSSLYSQRRKAQGILREPERSDDIYLDENLLKMSDGSPFLLADYVDGEERIMVFCTEKGKEIMKENKTFFMDGTFRSCSKQFAQLYTIHVDLGSTQEETNVTPIIFALLPNKRAETYNKMLGMLKEKIPDWKPERVVIDFEFASICALKQSFPLAEIQGCFFHFLQCIWRKVQEIGLTKLYKECQEVRLTIRKCGALAFLKPEDVEEGWLYIHEEAPQNPKLVQFLDYFVEGWLENPNVPQAIWNCHRRRHRTTNAVEGWHHKINSILGRPHPRVKDLILCLKSEAESSNLKIARNVLHLEGKRRKTNYVQLDQRIFRATEVYLESGNVKKFITNMSYILQLD